MNKGVGDAVERAMEERRTVRTKATDKGLNVLEDTYIKLSDQIAAPIIANGDPIGSVIICSKEDNVTFKDVEVKMAEVAASFFS